MENGLAHHGREEILPERNGHATSAKAPDKPNISNHQNGKLGNRVGSNGTTKNGNSLAHSAKTNGHAPAPSGAMVHTGSVRGSVDLALHAALSAILAVLLAWKVLFAVDPSQKQPGELRQFSSTLCASKQRRLKRISASDHSSSINSLFSRSDVGSSEELWFSPIEDIDSSTSNYEDCLTAMSSDTETTEERLLGARSGNLGKSPRESDSDSSDQELTGGRKIYGHSGVLPRDVGHLLETDLLPTQSMASRRPRVTPPAPPLPSVAPSRENKYSPAHGGDSPPISIVTLGVERDAAIAAALLTATAPHEAKTSIESRVDAESDHRTITLREYTLFCSGEDTPLTTDINVEMFPPLGYLEAIVEEGSDELRSGPSSTREPSISSASRPSGEDPYFDLSPSGQHSKETKKYQTLLGNRRGWEELGVESENTILTSTALKTRIPKLRLVDMAESGEEAEDTAALSSQREAATGLLQMDIEEPASSVHHVHVSEQDSKFSRSAQDLHKFQSVMEQDQDRDQFEVLVASDQLHCATPMEEGGRISSTSMSINLDRSRDSMLDQSICSNPRDETGAMAAAAPTKAAALAQITTAGPSSARKRKADQSEKASSTSGSEGEGEEGSLPPPPGHPDESLTVMAEGAGTSSAPLSTLTPSALMAESPLHVEEQIREGGDKENVPVGAGNGAAEEEERKSETEVKPVRQIEDTTARIATFLYGRAGAPFGEGPLVRTNESAKDESLHTRTHYISQLRGIGSPLLGSYSAQHPTDPFLSSASAYASRKEPAGYQHYSHEMQKQRSVYSNMGTAPAFSSSYNAPRYNLDMDLPPREPPPPPPTKSYLETLGYRPSVLLDDVSRDDLISEDNRSRSTIREIPIQRSASAFAPHSAMAASYDRSGRVPPLGTGANSVYNSSRYPPPAAGVGAPPQQEEYFRREVLTRTLVTRSTEALSCPPLSRSSPVERTEMARYYPFPEPALPPARDEVTEEYWQRYTRNVEEEERRIKLNQEKRRKDEDERRQREDDKRRRWEQEEAEHLEKLRRDREMMEKDFEKQMLERERQERDRVERDRQDREAAELRRREEWERIERERRKYEEAELEKRRQLEQLERERLERERLERERLELERLEKERQEKERMEKERVERERIERERLEIERLEIERIQRIKREQREKEEREKERQREEAERLERERQEAERLQRERVELERRERELVELQRREAEQRERERREEAMNEQRRRQQEERDRALLDQAEREAAERERQRRLKERLEQERLDRIRQEQERLEAERVDAERRERQRQEQERRELELREAHERAKEKREQERLDDDRREQERRDEEKREAERRQRERWEAQERERQRRNEEQEERRRLAELEAVAAERRAQRVEEDRLLRGLSELERRAEEMKEAEAREADRREKERLEEERRLAELREHERRNAEQREKERREAAEREATRRQDDRRSRERLDLIVREREDRERMEMEKWKLIAEKEAQDRKRQTMTSKETLEKLTRRPYYSRENLSTVGLGPAPVSGVSAIGVPDVTTKVERQIIERVDRTLWSSDGESRQAPLPFGYSGNARLPPSAMMDIQQVSPTSEDLAGGGGFNGYGRERIYNPKEEDFRRGGSVRTSKYKQRIEKARKEFLQGDTSLQHDPISERFRKSTEDLRRRVEYRGPLLQKFHSGELRGAEELGHHMPSSLAGYSRAGPTPYEQLETNLDDIHRSKSVLDYSLRQSRRDGEIGLDDDAAQHHHTRSKSADYLTDRSKLRDGVTPPALIPENELQKTIGDLYHQPGMEYESTRRSVERFQEPDWHRDYPVTSSYGRYDVSPPIGGISFPPGMFDKYKDEIEDVRRSRTSLHQLGASGITPPEHTKAFSKTGVHTLVGGRHQPGYTVSTVPREWNVTRDRNSRVVEVADTFIGKTNEPLPASAPRYEGRVTVEEVLDSIFQDLPYPEEPTDPGLPQLEQEPRQNVDGPGIFTANQALMNEVMQRPQSAEGLLKQESLAIRCAHCHKTARLHNAKGLYVSCKHCYTYYCCREHRLWDWERHRDRCSFARINTLCKEVIMKVRRDPETQFHMSRVAREGYRKDGRGSVNIRLISAHSAQRYLDEGWKVFAHHDPKQLLFYYPIQSLLDQRKEPSLIQLCRRYNPDDKFILSVSIIADIEQCPMTPPPEPISIGDQYQPQPQHLYTVPGHQRIHSAVVPTNV